MATETASVPALPPRGLAAGYGAPQGGQDEMVEQDGALRAHWRLLVSHLDDLGREQILRRWEQARRLIRENGITHNVYGDPNGRDRPWSLDLIPLILSAAEWKEVAEGLVQRARLLDILLADLYGPARSVLEGWLPPELLYANPGFLRACHGVELPQKRWLHLYSVDLVRLAEGQFRVLNDRTQAPSGAGYCLENRIVLSSVLPSAFRQCNVYRLAPFFMALRQTLKSLAPANRENPRVVLLTPGPYNETYFEHAYLARYLGYALVHGNDLTVRDGLVYLKTLGGLLRVDVILRRVDDDYCDPLELFQHSYLGVPGLVEAVRDGNVAVANALGSGMVQAPAFLSFLPALCKRLLGEDLKLPSVQTWWCGDPRSLKYVLENLSQLVIKPAYPTVGSDPEFGAELSRAQLDELAAHIAARPADYVAQEYVDSRTVPVLKDDAIESRRFVVRAHVVADQGSYSVMSGALTRVTGSPESRVVSMQRGGGSKDTWVIGDGPVNEVSLLSSVSQPLELSRGGGELTSRVADDLFWLGRYVQRAESDVRIARTVFVRLLDVGRADVLGTVQALKSALLGPGRRLFDGSELPALVGEVFDAGAVGGVRPSMERVCNLIRGLRDRMSADAWRILQGIERELAEFDDAIEDEQFGRVVELLNRLTVGFLAFDGVAAESMTRGHAWRFLDIGMRVERGISVARLVRSTLVEVVPEEPALLDAILEIADSSLTYRRRYLTQLQATAVVDLLVADETNPRAVAYQVAALEEHLAQLPRDGTHPQRSPDRQAVLKLRTHLRLADLHTLCQTDPASGMRRALDMLMSEVIDAMAKVSELVSQIYFSHAAVSHSLEGLGEEGAK